MSKRKNIPLIGGLLAGIAASICCVGPLLLLFFGFGGAWVSHLTALAPYRPIFISLSVIALYLAYLKIFRLKSDSPCIKTETCAKPSINNLYKWLFIGVLIIVFASIFSPYLIAVIYG